MNKSIHFCKAYIIDLILLDFAKAFDRVSHHLLLHKIEHYEVQGCTSQWIWDFLSNRRQKVLVDGQSSNKANETSVVPQGSVLGPLLFLAYINELPDSVKNSTTCLFADETAVYKRITSFADSTKLQEDLDSLQKLKTPGWCSCETLEVVDSAKYLGLNMDSKLNFNAHVSTTVKRANATLTFLGRNLYHCNKTIKEAAFKIYVHPIMEYAAVAAVAWDPHTQRNINKVKQAQRSCVCFVTNTYDHQSRVTPLAITPEQTTANTSSDALQYRIRFDQADINWRQFLTEATSNTRGHRSRYWTPGCSSQTFLSSYFPCTIREWNQLQEPSWLPNLDAF